MKKFTYLLVAGLFSLVLVNANAQSVRQSPPRSCPTFELMEKAFQSDPSARARYAATQQLIEQHLRTNPQMRTQAIINVPVVVHVLLPAANQAQVTNAIIQNQIDTLNFFYGASPFNTDSLRVYDPFRTTYGRSEIRFCMAQRTPANLPTNGIDRVLSNNVYAAGGAHPGEVVVWDPTKYLNIWVVNFGTSGILGYSYTPGSWAAGDLHQGFVNDYRAFGSGPGTGSGGFHYNEYNEGKTAVHEIGHYFNLAHTWGPNNNGNPTCTLSDGCSDTPPTSGPFFGCPTTVPVTNVCAPSAPGIMWQNHMDYADDNCMILFTKEQCARMMSAITTAPDRIGLLTSNGCSPIVTVPNDAGISAILTPTAGSSNACVPLTPIVTLTNFGTNSLTSVQINVILNGSPVAGSPFNWTGTLSPGGSTNVTLSALPITPVLGSNTLSICTSLPNGVADAQAGNDCSAASFNRVNGVALPVRDGFEGATYPLPGWSLTSGATWEKVNYANNGGANSIKADFWNFGSGTQFSLGTPEISVVSEPTVVVKFDISHKQYTPSNAQDRLEVRVTNDCGASFTTVYNKTSSTTSIPAPPALATTTAGGALADGGFVPNAANNWRTETVNLTGAILTPGHIQVYFRATSNFGNNLYVDNINIDKIYPRDLTVTAVTKPGIAECGPFAPTVTVQNVGLETVTAYTVTYSLDGGAPQSTTVNTTIAPGATANVTLGNISPAAGNHTINICTLNPVAASGTGDQNTGNDCFSKAFEMKLIVSTPLVEGFEAATFPSPGWSIINPNNNITFVRRPPGYQSVNSAFIDNFSQDLTGQLDFIQSPAFLVQGAGGVIADSVIITWDLAYQTYPGLSDELSVRTSSDCGNTFNNVVFSRSGLVLAGPAGSGTAAYLSPAANHWQHLRAATGAPNLAAGNLITTFRNMQGFGNNMFIDNINIQVLFKRDLKVVSIDKPLNIECSGNFTPSATVKNNGVEPITGFTISYSVDNGAAQNTTVTGVSLVRDASMTVNLTPAVAGLAAGQHSIKIYSSNPITASGTGDQLTINDTLTKAFGITGTTTAPLTEGFESTTFPPAGWAFTNPDGGVTWSRASVGKNSAGSAYMRNYAYATQNRVDELYSPSVTYNGVDSAQLSFDIAAATFNYPGTTGIQIDTLEVLVTKNCGATFTSVWKKWGEELQTINDPNYPQTVEFVPASADQWRTEVIDLTGSFTPNGPAQIVFRNTNNFENDIYIDNVNLTTRTLPASLKELGYLILPNPFTDQFTIWHLITPTNLRYASVYNSSGQLVWKQEFHGNATKQTTIDLRGKPSGTYIVNLGYDDRQRNVQVKVIKL